jgi:hypothetical protein
MQVHNIVYGQSHEVLVVLCVHLVFKTAICNVYRVSPLHVDKVVKELKAGIIKTAKSFSATRKVDLALLLELQRIAGSFGLHLSNKQLATANFLAAVLFFPLTAGWPLTSNWLMTCPLIVITRSMWSRS